MNGFRSIGVWSDVCSVDSENSWSKLEMFSQKVGVADAIQLTILFCALLPTHPTFTTIKRSLEEPSDFSFSRSILPAQYQTQESDHQTITRPQDTPMAKTKKDSKANKSKMVQPSETPETLYAQAIAYLEQSEPDNALATAQKLIAALPPSNPELQLPALNLLGEVNVELGNVEEARAYFIKATEIDPEGQIPETLGGGAEKFLWLAQLCEEGGAESVGWFEKGVRALKHEISVLEAQEGQKMSEEEKEAQEAMLEEKRSKLAEALCAVAEVYMTDLSYVLPLHLARHLAKSCRG